MILYNRKKVKYRKDGYCWKKRKDGKTTREDHMKLKVQGVEVRNASIGALPDMLATHWRGSINLPPCCEPPPPQVDCRPLHCSSLPWPGPAACVCHQ
ncbi:hypothetical protein MHYP_G00078560 [Metynnis hypsauchen]